MRIHHLALVEPSVDAECLTTEVFWQIRSSLPFIAASLKAAGYTCRVYCDELIHVERRYEEIAHGFQAVGISTTINTVERAIEIARGIRHHNPDIVILFGGIVAGQFSKQLLEVGDYCVIGRGEIVLPQLLDCLNAGGDPRNVPSLGFLVKQADGTLVSPTPDFTLPIRDWTDHPSDFDCIENYGGFSERRNVFGMPKPPLHSIFFSTGCIEKCRFCMADRKWKSRHVDNVMVDFEAILDRHRTLMSPRVMIVDDCTFGDIPKLQELLSRMAQLRKRRSFSVMMQFHVKPLIAHADTLAPLMVEAGVNTLLMGLETVSNESLADQKKRSTHEDNVKAIEICRRVGIVPYGYFVAGFETDTSDVIRAVFDFILEKRLVAQVLPIGITDVGPVGVGTESPLESLDPYSFGATIFVSSQHPQMATTELQSLLVEGYDRLFSFSRIPRMRTWKEMQYLFAYCVAYRKWRPRLLAHMRLLGAREQLTATLVDRGPTESRSGTRVKAHL